MKKIINSLLISAIAVLSGGTALAATLGFSYDLPQPSRFSSLGVLVNAVSQYLIRIAIPLAVIMIIYAGIRFLLARGNPGEVSKAKSVLWYTILGLAIVIIGVGFINLITNFLGLPK